MSTDEREIELVSKDSQKFRVKRKKALMSGLIKDMLEEQDEEDEEIPSLPVPNVESDPLKKVIEYMRYHWNDVATIIPKPLVKPLKDYISDWDNIFIDDTLSMIVDLVMAANYLNIKDLLELSSAKIIDLNKDKTPEEIKEMFGIENIKDKDDLKKIQEINEFKEEEES